MNQIFIFISLLFSLYIIIELIRINFLKKKNNILLLALISLLSIAFGIILVINFGLIIDYGKVDLHDMEKAIFTSGIGSINICIGAFSIGISIVKFIVHWFTKVTSH